MKPTARLRSFLLASSVLLTAPALLATNLYWDSNTTATAGAGATPTGTWGTSNFWNTDPLGGAAGALQIGTLNTDDLFFVAGPGAASGNTAYVVTVSGARVANSLTFQASGATTLSGGTSITLGNGTPGAGGITMNQFAYGAVAQGAVTISTALSLANSQTWTNNSTNALTFGQVTLGSTLTFAGTGNFTATAASFGNAGTGGIIMNGTGVLNTRVATSTNYTGSTTINSGVVLLNAGTKSTGNFNLNGGMVTDYFQQTGVFSGGLGTGTNQIQIHGNSGFGAGNGGSTWRIGSAGSILTWGSTHFDPTTLRFMTAADNLGPTIYGTAVLDNGLDLGAAARTIDVLNASANPATSGARINGVISNGSLIKTGGGNLTLNSAANTYGGTTTISAGFLSVATLANGGSNSSIGSSSAAASNLLLGNGATFRYTGGAVSTNRSFTINGTTAGHGASLDASGSGAVNYTETAPPAYGTVDQTRTLTLTGTNTGNNTLAALIADNGTGAVSLTKTGTGTWVLSNAGNSYTGATTLGGGSLQGSIPGGIGTLGGTSALIFNGGVLGLNSGDFTRSLDTNTTVTAVNFTGAGGWAAYGADRNVNLGGALAQVTWATANTGFNGQTLILGESSATHKVTLQNGLDLTTATRTVQVNDGTGLVDAELSGVITGGAAGSLTKTGAGTLRLSNGNTYTGVTTVSAGVLLLDNANALPGGIATAGGTSNLTFNGGVVGLTGDFTRSLNTAATATAATFTGDGGWAAYGGDRTVNLDGAGTPTTITWATASTGFNARTLILGATSADSKVILANSLALGNAARALRVDNGSAAIDAELSGAISGTGGSITRTGNGNLLISGNMSQTGGLSISTANGATTYFSGTNTYSGNTVNAFSNPATGRLVFQGMQSVSNTTTLTQTHGGGVGGFGEIRFLDDSGTPAAKTGFGINMTATNTSHGMNVFVGNNNTANGGSSAGTTTGSTIELGGLSMGQGANNGNTSSTFNLTGANGYRLQINNVTLATRTDLTAWNAIFNPGSAPLTIAGNVTQTNPSATVSTFLTLDGGASGNRIEGNILQPSGAALRVTKSNSSEWILSGTGSTYTGATTISGGTLAGIGANAFGSTSGISIAAASTATLSLRGDSSTSFVKASDSSLYAVTTTASGATINVNAATGVTTAKTMTIGTLALNNAVTNGTNFTGANNTSLSIGAVTTSAAASGTETLTNNISGSGILTLASLAVARTGTPEVVFNGTGSTTITGAISQAATTKLTKSGTGTLTLEGTNGYTGATAVNGGTLTIALGGSTHASSAITVSNTGSALVVNGTIGGTLVANASTTISGTGTVTGAATVSGNLNPGSSPGFLTFGNSLALANTTATTMEIAGTTLGIDYDAISVGTGLTYDGALSLALGATFGAGSYTFNLFDFGSQSGSFDTIALSGNYSGSLTNSLGVWTATTNSGNETWTFTQSTGDLGLVVIPEPRAVLLGGLGLLMLLRRRR